MEKFADEIPAGPQILLPCPVCFRTFKIESLERHQVICEKMVAKKRKIFDSAKQRIQGTDIPVGNVTKPTTNTMRKPLVSKIPSWKEKHLNLIKTVREARGADYSRCPYCERNFGNKAYDRHIEWCKDQQSRIQKSPTNPEAKERWEARTKYRAPPLRRSLRALTRDKYSPTRTISSAVSDCGNSLSGSRASLDSRASSNYSYQGYQSPNSHVYNNGNNTLGRATGSTFLRNTNERRSLRVPSSPPPVSLSQINNNRTSALRASLRAKKPINLTDSYPTQFTNVPKSPKTIPKSAPAKSTRPSVLQLFTSAFSRSSPTSKVAPSNSYSTPGRRSEPEGLESKFSFSSCSSYPQLTPQSKLKSNRYSDDGYDPYLSAQQQMAELFNDGGKSKNQDRKMAWTKEESKSRTSEPCSPKTDDGSMEKLEQDLKTILSEISQLGKPKENESWSRDSASSSRSTSREQLPKFCHACGSAYPEGAVVKFCCECGARRLYI